MGVVRLELRLGSQSEWIKIFDPRDWTVFVPTSEAIDNGTQLRIDMDVGGWLVTLRGTVVGTREEPAGIVVALGGTEREKINYLNGFVRGGLLNLREKRRLPVKLQVTYGAVEGPATTVTKDINEEGVFLFTDKPLPETSQVHMLVTVPGKPQPLSLVGKVSHTILAHDEEPPGMGIVFDLDDSTREQLVAVIREIEEALEKGVLPSPLVE
ncbi:MAG TPA: PilZ domain-containing protein [Kofleriaceae bacterium]|nr:PilZ domain-containing protein [Kofleriaceae bacterium]